MEGFRLVKKEANYVIRGDLEENTTVYYSNFRLFNEEAEIMFSKYISFKKDLETLLGEEWHDYANKAIYKASKGTKIFVSSQLLFELCLELWLELRKSLKISLEKKNQPNTAPITPTGQTTNEKSEFQEEIKIEEIVPQETNSDFLDLFQQKIIEKFPSQEIQSTNFKAITQAFYISASKVWKEMINWYSGESVKNEGFLFESKKFLLNKLQTFYSNSKVLKPILVATKRIKDFVIESNKKVIQQPQPNLQEKELKNLNNFSSNIQIENPVTLTDKVSLDEHELKRSFKQLRITSNNEGSLLGKRSAIQANSTVEIKRASKKIEKLLNPNIVEFAAHYINRFVKTSNLDWQVSRNFVTNMVEVNYNKFIQLENNLNHKAQGLTNDVRIRFIQPAQDFYNRLMETWIIFKLHSTNKEILFTEYLDKVKSTLGGLWNDQLIAAVQNFFMTLYYEWNKLKQPDTENEEKILFFIKKVKDNMHRIWEENVVKKAEELSNKIIPTR